MASCNGFQRVEMIGEKLKRLTGNRFVVIGRAGMDFYPDPPGTKTEEARRFVAELGGSSANIAVALARHGAEVSLVTRVSEDAVGRFVLNELRRYGINADHVALQDGQARTSLAVSETRIEDHQTVIYRNNAADFAMTPDDVAVVDFGGFDALIATGTIFAAEPSREAGFRAFDTARTTGIPVVFDVDYRPYSWASAEEAAATYSRAAAKVDIIIGNDVEFGFMAGGHDKGLAKARALAASGTALVIYKMGEAGAITISGDAEFRTGIYPVTALKPTGAGDAFMGGFLAALAAGFDVRNAVLRGSACASIVVSNVGCAPAMPNSAELEEFLATHPGPTG